MGHSEASIAAHERFSTRWGLLTLGAVALAVASAWWTVDWFVSLFWAKALLTGSLCSLPLIGWALFLSLQGDKTRTWDLRKLMATLGLVIVVFSTTAVVSLCGARMIGVTIQEEQTETGTAESERASAEDISRNERIALLKKLLNIVAAIAAMLLAIAGEVAAGVAYHEYTKHATVVRTVRPFYGEWARLRAALIANAKAQEHARVRPQILYAQLTAAALEREAALAAAALEREAVLAAEDRRARTMAPTLKWSIAGVGILLGALAATPSSRAHAVPLAEVTVIILDLSTSVGAAREFGANVAAVERVIRDAPARARLVVLPVDEVSFSGAPLFAAQSPREAGRFGEHLAGWRTKTTRTWRDAAAKLGPRARGSDIAGAIGRAALEFEEAPTAGKRLILFSDMRQVGRGLNLERPVGDAVALAEHLYRHSPVTLTGVEVSVLGAHAAGIDERHWRALRVVWTEYFTRAGTKLTAFSPNRRLVRAE
jgi:hypothetical protein